MARRRGWRRKGRKGRFCPRAKLQATGIDRAGRRQYIYHPEFRARQEQEKFEKFVRFAERLPDLRHAMSEHIERLGNTLAVARTSYVSPAVVDQYFDGRTNDDFGPRHLRVVGGDRGLDLEERALLDLLRSW